MTKQMSLPFTLMRGGTSKGVFLREGDVPADRARLVPLILDLFGSPDRRQIDGMGGADKLTSKVAIIGKPIRSETDLTYLFGQVGVSAAEVDFKPNCGNLTSAVAMYAIQEGLVAPEEGVTTVRIHNINTDKVIHAEVQVRGGIPLIEGQLSIGGVPGSGAPIALDFSRAAGATTGKLLPLGDPAVNLPVPGYGSIEVTVVDCANLVVFVSADSLGMVGTETPAQIDGDIALVARINAIRKAVAHEVGLGEYWDSRVSPAIPLLIAVQKPTPYKKFTDGTEVHAESIDLVCRSYATGSAAQALATTGTACTGAACRIEGSIPSRYLAKRALSRELIEIGHPSGVIGVEARVDESSAGRTVHSAKILRTARRLADGTVYLKQSGY
ncbi:2-methylaconitate cis-trans isomerase PrpF family protein [Caballeronia sp. 15711]|uniref:2-methylaconitate cis-trans isomerase PrpF family protein n=1 Tax=Caballeronia sp. 15711 TaxID=3391029 RepID=UPI0039E67659